MGSNRDIGGFLQIISAFCKVLKTKNKKFFI